MISLIRGIKKKPNKTEKHKASAHRHREQIGDYQEEGTGAEQNG